MSKEKQIEEMVKDITLADKESLEYCHTVKCSECHYFYKKEDCYMRRLSENLIAKGYRKQSEGEWEKRVFIIFDSEKVGYRCAECNTTWDTPTPYCPNCGAKMKGEQ